MNTTPWLENFKRLLEANSLPYYLPHTIIDVETSHEWFNHDRSVGVIERQLVVFEGTAPEMLKVWGINISTEMESVSLHDEVGLIAAWKWFLGV